MLKRPNFALSPARKLLARESDYMTVGIYDVDDGVEEPRCTIEPPGIGIVALGFVEEDELWILSRDGHLSAHRVASRDVEADKGESALEPLWKERLGADITVARFGGALLAAGDQKGQTWLIGRGADGEATVHLGEERHYDAIVALELSPDGLTLATSGRDRCIRIWRVDPAADAPDSPHGTLSCERTFRGAEGWQICLAFSGDGRRLASGGMDYGVYLWQLDSDAEGPKHIRYAHSGWVADVAWSPDDTVVATGSWDSTIGLFDGRDLTPRVCFEFHRDYVSDVEFIGASTLLASSHDQLVSVWNWRDGTLDGVLEGHVDWVEAIELIDDQHALTVSSDHTARVWDVGSRRAQQVIGAVEGAGISLGAAVDMSAFVDTTQLASYTRTADVSESRYRDYRATGFRQSSEQSAMGLLEGALGDEPEPPPPELVTPPSEPESTTAIVERFTRKLEAPPVVDPGEPSAPDDIFEAADIVVQQEPLVEDPQPEPPVEDPQPEPEPEPPVEDPQPEPEPEPPVEDPEPSEVTGFDEDPLEALTMSLGSEPSTARLEALEPPVTFESVADPPSIEMQGDMLHSSMSEGAVDDEWEELAQSVDPSVFRTDGWGRVTEPAERPPVSAEPPETSEVVFDTSPAEIWTRLPSATLPTNTILAQRARPGARRFARSQTIRTPHGFVYGVALTPDGSRIATCGGDNSVCVWNRAGELQHRVRVDHDGLSAVAFSFDGRAIVAGGDDATVHLWLLPEPDDVRTPIRHAPLAGHKGWITSVAFSDEGSFVLTGSHDGTARVWKLETGQCVRTLGGHDGPVTGVAIGTHHAFTVGHDGAVYVWNQKWGQVDLIEGHDRLLGVSSNGDVTAYCAANGEVFAIRDGQPSPLLQHRGQARAVRVRGDGAIFSVGEDGHLRIYLPGSNDPSQSLSAGAPLWCVDARTDVVAVGADDGNVYLFTDPEAP